MPGRSRLKTAVAGALAAALLATAVPARADDYDSGHAGHPLRIIAYALHPVGVAIDYLLMRPAHWLVHKEPAKTIFDAWLAPLRTVMTLASGTAVFLFIASSLVSNINFLASGGAATSAQEASRDNTTNFQVQAPTAAQAGSSPARALGPAPSAAPTGSAGAALAQNPTGSPVKAADAVAAPSPDDAGKVLDRAAAGSSSAPGVGAPQDRGQFASSEPQRSPLLSPWLWLTLAIFCGAIAIALQRRLRRSA